MRPAALFFVHNHPAKFVQIDLALLAERYGVREWYQKSRVINLFALAFAVWQSDLVFGWFASWHTLFPVLFARLFRKPSVLVVGGYDTANMPEIGYGSMRGGIKRWITIATMNLATRLITNSFFTRDEVIRNGGVAPDKVTAIYHGIESSQGLPAAKRTLVITVGNIDHDNLQRKGLEAFVRAAALVPDIPFVVIGAWRDASIRFLQSIATPNVKFTNWVGESELENYFVRARVYVQASRHEGFGLAVAEAMVRKCVPVVTQDGALPEVVDDDGIYLDSPTPQAIAEGVRRALTLDDTWGQRARERIEREFPLARRRAQIFDLLEQLLR